MQAPPVFQLSVRHFGLWRGALGGLLALSWCGLLAWCAMPGAASSQMVFAFLLGLICSVLLLPLFRTPAFSLRWDSQAWWLGPEGSSGEEPQSGQVQVALDFGSWLLLSFRPAGPGRRRWSASRWLPVQRLGHGSAWHALRCAVHFPAAQRAEAARAQPRF